MRSIRSLCLARTNEHGYALIAAIALAVLYFAVMQLILIDSSRALHEAQRFRSKIIAETLAENAAELASAGMVERTGAQVEATNDQGRMRATYHRAADTFELTAHAQSLGAEPRDCDVKLQGRIDGARILIDYSSHSQ